MRHQKEINLTLLYVDMKLKGRILLKLTSRRTNLTIVGYYQSPRQVFEREYLVQELTLNEYLLYANKNRDWAELHLGDYGEDADDGPS